MNDMAGIRVSKIFEASAIEAGGYENITYNAKDCINYVAKARQLRLGEGDVVALMAYFRRMQKCCPGFYFDIDLDMEGRLQNVFWADVRSREAYKEFGDVVSFDTTYLVNKYHMPFAPFVGVNHHGQSTLLGCGLLSSEDTLQETVLSATKTTSDRKSQSLVLRISDRYLRLNKFWSLILISDRTWSLIGRK